MLNAFRYVKYEGDGVDVFECLSCKKKWWSQSWPGPFCSYCGIRWSFEVKPPEGERYWPTRTRDLVPWKHEEPPWVIERRCRGFFDDRAWGEWASYERTNGPASYVLRHLRDLRRYEDPDDEFPVEYRARRAQKVTT
jgi:hypothetical protein